MKRIATTPTVWPLAEATIRHRAGSDDQGDGSLGPFFYQAVGVVARTFAPRRARTETRAGGRSRLPHAPGGS